MAKQIKAIKCPQCGSSRNTLIKDDYYRCDSCGTEYFLDNDDINVHIDHRIPQPEQPQFDLARTIKIIAAGIGGFSVVFFLFLLLVAILPSKHSGNSGNRSEKPANTYMEYSWRDAQLFPAADGHAVLFYIAERRYNGYGSEENRNGYYMMFRDVETWKMLKQYRLPMEVDRTDYRYFPSLGKPFLIVNEQFLYELHPDTYTLEDVKESMFRTLSEFSSGVASVKFVYSEDADMFLVVNNMGKEYRYFPAQDRLYTEKEYNAVDSGFDTLLPGATEKVYYRFTEKSTYFPDEILQLIGVTYMYNNGGPSYCIPRSLSWDRDFHDNRKVLFDRPGLYRYVSHRDLTPGRNYIDPAVLYYDDKHVLIRFKPTASPDAVPSIQLLDTKGNLCWTQTGIYKIEWNTIVLKTDEYLWVLIEDGTGRKTKKFLKIKLDGSDPTIIEIPATMKD